jgi:glycosyltransferase involved in cell wall biosynthesis
MNTITEPGGTAGGSMHDKRLALEILGPYRGASGHDRHTRALVKEMWRMGVEMRLHQLHGWSPDLPPELRDPFFDRFSQPVEGGAVLHFAMPIQTAPWPGKPNLNYTMFEADRIPASWAAARGHDCVIVPCESSRQAWINTGVPAHELRICPLGVDADYFATPSDPLPLMTASGRRLDSFAFRFLNIAEVCPRKNHLGLLRTWLQATRSSDDAVLVVKAGLWNQHLEARFYADLDQMMRKHNLTFESAAPVVFLTERFSEPILRSLLWSCTHYFSMSFGEGWDLVMMEAACAGLDLLAPAHTAYLDYLTPSEAHLIPAYSAPVHFEGSIRADDWIFFGGLNWWQPDEDAAVSLLRGILDGSVARKPSLRERISQEYRWETAARTLVAIISEVSESARTVG